MVFEPFLLRGCSVTRSAPRTKTNQLEKLKEENKQVCNGYGSEGGHCFLRYSVPPSYSGCQQLRPALCEPCCSAACPAAQHLLSAGSIWRIIKRTGFQLISRLPWLSSNMLLDNKNCNYLVNCEEKQVSIKCEQQADVFSFERNSFAIAFLLIAGRLCPFARPTGTLLSCLVHSEHEAEDL